MINFVINLICMKSWVRPFATMFSAYFGKNIVLVVVPFGRGPRRHQHGVIWILIFCCLYFIIINYNRTISANERLTGCRRLVLSTCKAVRTPATTTSAGEFSGPSQSCRRRRRHVLLTPTAPVPMRSSRAVKFLPAFGQPRLN